MRKMIFIMIISVSFGFSTYDMDLENTYLKKGYTVALSKKYFDEMIDATSTGDRGYFAQLIKDYKIVTLPKDTRVSILESSILKGTVVARIYGKETKVWTVREALIYK